MNRTQLACYSLLASAFILGALVTIQASRLVNSSAHAEMVVHKDVFTMISTQLRADAEGVFVLDSRQEKLLVYMVDPNRNTIELLPGGVLEVGRAFEQLVRPAGPATPQRRPVR